MMEGQQVKHLLEEENDAIKGMVSCQIIRFLLIQLLSQAGTSSSAASAPAVAAAATPTKADKPIFTLKQMSMIGEAIKCLAGPQNLKLILFQPSGCVPSALSKCEQSMTRSFSKSFQSRF